MSKFDSHRRANPVTWFEIYVNDLERARVFYEALLDCSLTPLVNDGSFSALSFPGQMPQMGAMGALIHHPMREANPGGSVVYFHVENCAHQTAKVLALGGQVIRDKWAIGEDGFIALIADSEGNTIGLHSFQ
jgi:predicted enzyme related to lactoylglutathione lyase